MDVNNTKFHLLLTRADWGNCALANGITLGDIWQSEDAGETFAGQPFDWDAEANEIALRRRVFKFKASEKDVKPRLENRRGAASDRYGNWYWIDETGLKIKVLSNGSKNVSDFYPSAAKVDKTPQQGAFQPVEVVEETPVAMRGLAVTIDHFLVVGTLAPAGLLVFDLFAGGEPRRISWREDAAFAPFDMAARRCGGVFVLDRENRRYWTLDRDFNAVGKDVSSVETADDFQPIDDEAKRTHSEKNAAEDYFSDLSEMSDPISIEALPDDTVLILNLPQTEDFSTVYRYYRGANLDDLKTEDILKLVDETNRDNSSPPKRFRLRGFDLTFLGADDEDERNRLFIVTEDGNQAFSFRLVCKDDLQISPFPDLPPTVVKKNFELQPLDDYYPMRLFGGKGLHGAFDGKVYYDFGERWLPLVKQNRPSYVETGTLFSAIFDGKEPNCVWHRLTLDGCLAAETAIEIYSRTADEEGDLETSDWQKEPNLYLRGDGSELPFVNRKTSKENGFGTWELLFQRAVNRYLQLKFVFSGNGQRTPRVSALRVYYPRFSYLNNYLPAIYRDDEQSAFFLDRFLANFEGFYTTIEERIAAVQMLFDVRSAPPDALEWLADWLGAVLDPAWSEAKRRLFISRAVDFYQYRGTLRGIRVALRLALDNCADESIFETQTAEQKRRDPVRIVERFLTRRTPEIIPPDSFPSDGFLRDVALTPRWNPSQGADVLHQRYREKIGENSSLKYPLVRPEDAEEVAIWQSFSMEVLGFAPSVAAAEQRKWQDFLQDRYEDEIDDLNDAHDTNYDAFDEIFLPDGTEKGAKLQADWQTFIEDFPSRSRKLWQDFLARRYRRIRQLNDAYQTDWQSFETVSLFDQVPPTGKPLADWFQFEGAVLPMHTAAHRFTVLIPAALNGKRLEGAAEQARQLSLVERVVNLEKPAHTTFDFRYYWNLFRLDEVRLGYDTLLGLGSRDPQLNPDLIVGQSFVGESRVGISQPEKYSERYVLGSEAFLRRKDGGK